MSLVYSLFTCNAVMSLGTLMGFKEACLMEGETRLVAESPGPLMVSQYSVQPALQCFDFQDETATKQVSWDCFLNYPPPGT